MTPSNAFTFSRFLSPALRLGMSLLLGLGSWAAKAEDSWKRLTSLPDPLGVAAPFAGVSGGALIVAGGANFPNGMPWEGGKKVWVDRIWALDQPEGQWRKLGSLPRPLAYGISVSDVTGVICLGGSDAERHYSDAFRLSVQAEVLKIDFLAPLPIPLANAAGVISKGHLYVVGGASEPGEKSASARAFSLSLRESGSAWQELPPLPSGRLLPMAGPLDQGFLVCGGASLEKNAEGKVVRRYLKEVWAYDTRKKAWEPWPEMPHTIVAAATPLPQIKDEGGSTSLLVIGGDDGSKVGFSPPQNHPGFLPHLLSLDLTTRRWTSSPSLPAPRATLPSVEWNDHIILPSGEVRPGVRSPEIWAWRRGK